MLTCQVDLRKTHKNVSNRIGYGRTGAHWRIPCVKHRNYRSALYIQQLPQPFFKHGIQVISIIFAQPELVICPNQYSTIRAPFKEVWCEDLLQKKQHQIYTSLRLKPRFVTHTSMLPRNTLTLYAPIQALRPKSDG